MDTKICPIIRIEYVRLRSQYVHIRTCKTAHVPAPRISGPNLTGQTEFTEAWLDISDWESQKVEAWAQARMLVQKITQICTNASSPFSLGKFNYY